MTLREHILVMMRACEEVKSADIILATKATRPQVNAALYAMCEQGKIERVCQGVYRLARMKKAPALPVTPSSGFIRPLTKAELMRGRAQ